MKRYDLGMLGGDGIGPEVVREAAGTVDAAAELFGFKIDWLALPYGADYYLTHGTALPESGIREMADLDAMLLGAIGDPRVKPGPLEQEILLALRFHFDQYVNLRPAMSFPGVPTPVAAPAGRSLDAVVVRENTEDFYMGLGGTGTGAFRTTLAAKRRHYEFAGALDARVSDAVEIAFTLGVMSRPGVERITRYACKLARARNETTVHLVSKANAVPHLYGFWDRIAAETAKKEFPDMTLAPVNVDAMCYLLVRDPFAYGVVLCPNLFGDIVSDLYSGLAGGLGLAAAGNIGDGLSMFEPVHGSAPGIARTGRANPLAAILSAAMMLEHVGEGEAARAIEKAVRAYLESDSPKPIEQGGSATTGEAGDRVRELLTAT